LNSQIQEHEKYRFIKKLSLVILILFFLFSGINHFLNPETYYPLIPPYLPFPVAINIISGIAEIVFSLLLIFKRTRKLAAYSLIILLILFIPAHIHFIVIGGCIEGGFCFPMIVAWLRLIVIHPLLIFWIWTNRK